MKYYEDVLSKQLLDRIQFDFRKRVSKYAWSSNIPWQQELKFGVSGICIQSRVGKELYDDILKEIKHFLPEALEYTLMYNIWPPNSGIAMHDDDNKVFGATIYLNEEWSVNDGGIFLFKNSENKESEWNAIVPRKNTMVVNDENEIHLVTQVSPLSEDMRITIQVWGNDHKVWEGDDKPWLN